MDCYQDHLVKKDQTETKMEKEMIEQVARKNDITIPPQKPMKSICELQCKCKTCLVSYKVNAKVAHRCGYGQCANCLNYVDLYSHQCYIMSDIYKANKRYDNKLKAEDRILESIKEMTTADGKKVKEVAKQSITREEWEKETLKNRPMYKQGESRQAFIERVKNELQDLGVDVTQIPEDQLQDF